VSIQFQMWPVLFDPRKPFWNALIRWGPVRSAWKEKYELQIWGTTQGSLTRTAKSVAKKLGIRLPKPDVRKG